MNEDERAVLIRVSGRVQGVNFRNFTKGEARRLGVRGWVVNRDDGSVEAALQGPGGALAKMVELCRRGPSYAGVDNLDVRSTDRGHIEAPPPDAYTF